MAFPLQDFLERALSLVMLLTDEDIAHCRIVLYDGAFESTISIDPQTPQHHLLVTATLHHEDHTVSQSFVYGGTGDLDNLVHGIQQACNRAQLSVSAAELYKWVNHRDHDQHVKRTERLLDREWRTAQSETQTKDLRDRDAMFSFIEGLKAKLLPWWRPVSEGCVEAQWLTGVDEENALFFAAWVALIAPQDKLEFFAQSDLTAIGREVNDHFAEYTTEERFLRGFDAKTELWRALQAFRARSLPTIKA